MLTAADIERLVNEFGPSCQIRMANSNAADEPRDPLFHYTSTRALESIITSEQLWFTSIYFMDDDAELNFGYDLAMSKFRVARQIDRANKLFFDGQLEGDMRADIRNAFEFYSISFGQRDDLQQWIDYGQNRSGVALGLAPEFFHPQVKDLPKPDEMFFFGKVHYGAESAGRHQPVIDAAAALVTKIGDTIREPKAVPPLFKNVASDMLVEVLWNCVTTKDEKWRHQNETRLLALNHRKAPRFKISNAELRPRVEIQQPTLRRHLTEIMIGSKAPADTEQVIATLLKRTNLSKVTVTRSSL